MVRTLVVSGCPKKDQDHNAKLANCTDLSITHSKPSLEILLFVILTYGLGLGFMMPATKALAIYVTNRTYLSFQCPSAVFL